MAKRTIEVPRKALSDLAARMIWTRSALATGDERERDIAAALLADGIVRVNGLLGLDPKSTACACFVVPREG